MELKSLISKEHCLILNSTTEALLEMIKYRRMQQLITCRLLELQKQYRPWRTNR